MERALLAGATGYLGRFILDELQQRRYPVKVIVRDASKVRVDGHPELEIYEAQVTDPDSIKGSCDGIDVVISTVGITRQKDGLSYMHVDFQANVNLLEEAQRAGVRKFIYVSALNADKLTNLAICKAKEMFVEKLKSSELDFCVIRPNGFFSDMAEFVSMAQQGRVYLFGGGKFRSNPIHGADLAVVCADAINLPDQEIEVGGPETFSHEEIAKLAFETVEKPAKISCIPEWLRKSILRTLQLFTKQTFHGPIEFFMTVMAMDMVAPQYGKQTLKEFFASLNKECKR